MKLLFKIFAIAILFTACEDVEPTLFNPSSDESPTFLSFSSSLYSIPVIRDSIGSVDIVLNSSTVSNVDRTYNLEFIPNETSSAANPETYSLPASITIPANSYQGTITVNAQDNGLVDSDRKVVEFRIVGLNGADVDNDLVTLNIFEVCPIQDDFTGAYRFTQVTAPIANGNQQIFLFAQSSLVNVELGDNEFERVFTANVWPGFFDIPLEVKMTFQCDNRVVVASSRINSFCGSAPEQGDPNYWRIGEASTPGIYNTNDDSTITIRVKEDASGSCLSNGRDVTFVLEKVQ